MGSSPPSGRSAAPPPTRGAWLPMCPSSPRARAGGAVAGVRERVEEQFARVVPSPAGARARWSTRRAQEIQLALTSQPIDEHRAPDLGAQHLARHVVRQRAVGAALRAAAACRCRATAERPRRGARAHGERGLVRHVALQRVDACAGASMARTPSECAGDVPAARRAARLARPASDQRGGRDHRAAGHQVGGVGPELHRARRARSGSEAGHLALPARHAA